MTRPVAHTCTRCGLAPSAAGSSVCAGCLSTIRLVSGLKPMTTSQLARRENPRPLRRSATTRYRLLKELTDQIRRYVRQAPLSASLVDQAAHVEMLTENEARNILDAVWALDAISLGIAATMGELANDLRASGLVEKDERPRVERMREVA